MSILAERVACSATVFSYIYCENFGEIYPFLLNTHTIYFLCMILKCSHYISTTNTTQNIIFSLFFLPVCLSTDSIRCKFCTIFVIFISTKNNSYLFFFMLLFELACNSNGFVIWQLIGCETVTNLLIMPVKLLNT